MDMRMTGKKMTAAIVAAATVLNMGILASAAVAAPAATPFGITVQKNAVLFTKSGKTVTTYQVKDTNLKLTTSATTQNMLLGLTKADGTAANISLGQQTSLDISGAMTSLTIADALADNIAVNLLTGSSATTVTVASPNAVAINGKVGTLNVTAPATVTLAKGAAVTKKNVTNKTAKVTVATTNTVTAAGTPATTTPAASTGKGTLKLHIKNIYAEDDDSTLQDLLEDLNDNVYATDTKTTDEVAGTCAWTSGRNTIVDEDMTATFTFTPSSSKYAPITGKVKIFAELKSSELTLHFGTLSYGSGGKLKDYLSDLKKEVYATDENGDEVDGKCSWDSKSSTEVDKGRSYAFTFKPDSSKYAKETGRITIE